MPSHSSSRKGGKFTHMKIAPKKTPKQLKPWMRIVETVRADPQYTNLPYKQQLKIASENYRNI